MSCSPYDLKDFFFGELEAAQGRQVEEHLEGCPECREEFERLRLTRTALDSLREEEPPRRIAFVSDSVFEPRWWRALWQSGPRLGFASAAMLALAILVHAVTRPAPNVAPAPDTAAIEARIGAEVAQRIEPAVRAAVAESEARQAKKTEGLVSAARKDFELQRDADRVAIAETLVLLQKKYNVLQLASVEWGARP
ncbi:MAG: zf-HC2 domain-containing protein [Bryobacteraceae bacterium]|jgi:anti-sigma factor RsiW